jgi:hypothetical protein
MGGSTSKVSTSEVYNAVYSATSRVVQSCVTDVAQTQDAVIRNSGVMGLFGGSVSQKASVSATCLATSQTKTAIYNEIMNSLKQLAQSKGITALESNNSSASAMIQQYIQSSISTSTDQSQVTKLLQEQKSGIINTGLALFAGVSISQGADVIAKHVADSANTNSITSILNQNVDQTAKSETKAAWDVFDPSKYGKYLVLLLVVGVIGVAIFLLIPEDSKNGGIDDLMKLADDEDGVGIRGSDQEYEDDDNVAEEDEEEDEEEDDNGDGDEEMEKDYLEEDDE